MSATTNDQMAERAAGLLVMLPIIVKEGVEALRGETCCDDGACH